jgi:CrcB protein
MPTWFIAFCTHPITLLMVGGGVGTNARYWLGKLVRQIQGLDVLFPWATFFINVSGSLILGLLAATYLYQKDIHNQSPTRDLWFLLLGTGFCGGFTTFSTFSLETYELIAEGKTWIALLYVLGSVGGGLLGVWLAVRWSGS